MNKKNLLIVAGALVLVAACAVIFSIKSKDSGSDAGLNEIHASGSSIESGLIEETEAESSDKSGSSAVEQIDESGESDGCIVEQKDESTYVIKQDDGSEVTIEFGVSEMSAVQEGETEADKPASSATPTATPAPSAKPAAKPSAQPSSSPAADEQTGTLKWEEFYALSPEEMDAYLYSFSDMDAFYEWMVAAQEQFKKDYPDIEIGPGGSIDLSQIK